MMPQRATIGAFLLTLGLVGLVSAAINELTPVFSWIMMISLGLCVTLIQTLFPGSRLLAISLANLLAIYASFFALLVESIFRDVGHHIVEFGFTLPIAAFMFGTLRRRKAISAVVRDRLPDRRHRLGRAFFWLVPMLGIAALSVGISTLDVPETWHETSFVAAMTAIALTVYSVSEDVAAFLIETGLLFEEFFDRVARLIAPAFAFLTFYTLNVVIFACIYRLMDKLAPGHHFLISGGHRAMTFADALYFSLVTVATVGFGDIVPNSDATRLLTGFQVICGILLLLFGFSEIFAYSRERRNRWDD